MAHMRKYFGQMTVRKASAKGKKAAGIEVLNLVDTFNYVASVVGGETTPAFGKRGFEGAGCARLCTFVPQG